MRKRFNFTALLTLLLISLLAVCFTGCVPKEQKNPAPLTDSIADDNCTPSCYTPGAEVGIIDDNSTPSCHTPMIEVLIIYDANGGFNYQPEGGYIGIEYSWISTKLPHTVLQPEGFVQRSRYIFKCWNTKRDGSGTDYMPGDTIDSTAFYTIYNSSAGSFHLYAIWEKDPAASPTPYLNDCHFAYANYFEGAVSEAYFEYLFDSSDFPCIIKTPESVGFKLREGYVFKCWNTYEDGSGTNYMPGDVLNSPDDVPFEKLYTIWEKVS